MLDRDLRHGYLLQAALLSGEGSLAAWRKVEPGLDLDELDGASHRIIPLLVNNLLENGIPDSELSKYQSVSKFYWYRNQLLLASAEKILSTFIAAGLPSLFLKGIPLAAEIYPKNGLRPYGDVDILVPEAQLDEALALLGAEGYVSVEDSAMDMQRSYRHAISFENKKGLPLDLHWHVLYRPWEGYHDELFWDAALPFALGEQDSLTLSASDHFFHACVHGVAWNHAPIRWAADAALILKQKGDEIDWARVKFLTQTFRYEELFSEQLSYLRDLLQMEALAEPIEQIKALSRWRFGKAEYRALSKRPNLFRFVQRFFFHHYRLSEQRSVFRALVSFPAYLLRYWGLNSYAALMGTMFSRGRKWLRSGGNE